MSAKAELIWFEGVLHTMGGQVLMFGTLDECANEYLDQMIVVPSSVDRMNRIVR